MPRKRKTTGLWCKQPTTGYAVQCGEVATFLVGLPSQPGTEACAQHLAKAARAEAERLGVTSVAVQLVPYRNQAA